MEPPSGAITRLLTQLKSGNREAESQLISLVYDELRNLAAHYLRLERPGHSLNATALVNEAYLRLVEQKGVDWQGRAHFFGVAAQIMRRVLVDHARKRMADKRGGARQKISLDDVVLVDERRSDELLVLDDALHRLEQWDLQQSRIVEMRFFGGLTEDEIALVLGISTRTVKRDWSVARAWLYGEMSK